MNARLSLTDKERAQCRAKVFSECRSDHGFVIEAMQEGANAWFDAYLKDDPIAMSKAIDQDVLNYCEACDLFAEAERDLLAGIEIGGGRRLA